MPRSRETMPSKYEDIIPEDEEVEEHFPTKEEEKWLTKEFYGGKYRDPKEVKEKIKKSKRKIKRIFGPQKDLFT